MDTCSATLERAYKDAEAQLLKPFVTNKEIAERIKFAAMCPSNRAGARFLLAATLAKVTQPNVDIRKPFIQAYPDDQKADAYPGRNYDEQYVFEFITRHKLPCSSTTAFLTPGFRTKNIVLDLTQKLRGRPPELYEFILEILDAIQSGKIKADVVMRETIRLLIVQREARALKLQKLKKDLQEQAGELPLSSEDTVKLIEQHLALKYAARLPVLVVAAAYTAASAKLGERVLSLNAHNAADKQTGALGDVEITLADDDNVVTAYEMKDKAVTIGDINIAIQKIADGADIQNYIFVTTDRIDAEVREYAAKQYKELGGVEIAILDCIGFLRHFLHLFHRLRTDFLDAYQELVLAQPESGVNQALKEAFLALRKAAQAEG
ncbi:MAG: DNA methyltransferase [Phycisphaerae bacterium]|nr:MAG: restriction endonuclease, SacI family [Planctomycetia bacterium]RIK70801.1 MAG: DNA methyltransferase [Planctomycetota bacterium]GJQ27157.1 MAG: DNA methyltransferase [Phycisphaerae bacterium]